MLARDLAVLPRRAPDSAEQPCERILDLAHGQFDVGDAGLRLRVVWMLGRIPPGGGLIVGLDPADQADPPYAHRGDRIVRVHAEHLLELGFRRVHVAALHCRLRRLEGALGLGRARLDRPTRAAAQQDARPGPSAAAGWPAASSDWLGGPAPSPGGELQAERAATRITWDSQSLTCVSGSAPMNPSAIWPAMTATTIGMLWTCRAALSCGLESTSTRASTKAPFASVASFSRIGPSCLHGPHHSAHRSRTTGTGPGNRSKAPDERPALFKTLMHGVAGRASDLGDHRLLLALRRDEPDLFTSSDYQPLVIEGDRSDWAFGYLRTSGDRKLAVVMARYPAHRQAERTWNSTVQLPEARWFDLFRGQDATVNAPLDEWLHPLPFTVLVAR